MTTSDDAVALTSVSRTRELAVKWAPLILAVVYFAVMMPLGARLILVYPDERHYAYGGASMIETGDWLIPRTPQGDIRLKKPVVPYWFSAVGFEVLGIGVAGFRLLWVLAASGILLLTFALARVLGASRRIAIFGELLLAANPVFLRATLDAVPDIPLTLFMILATLGFVQLLRDPGGPRATAAAWAAWIGTALAVLSKGLLPVVFVVFLLAYAALFDRRGLRALLSPLPIAAALLLVAGWFGYAAMSFPREFAEQFFGDQLDRAPANFLGPVRAIPAYFAVSIFSFLGWPLILFLAYGKAARSLLVRRWSGVRIMLVGWCLLAAVIFGLSSIIDPRYLLPVLPILAALLAIDFGAVDGEWLPHLSQISRVVLVPVCLVGLVLAVFGAAVYMELVSIAAGVVFLAAAAAVWAGLAALGWRQQALAPFLLCATPVAAFALLLATAAPIVLPDLGEPLAEKLKASGAAPQDASFIGEIHAAFALRLHTDRADAFEELTEMPDGDEGLDCVMMTSDASVADRLASHGYNVETLQAGWRTIEPSVLFRAVIENKLAEVRARNAATVFFATCPQPPKPVQ